MDRILNTSILKTNKFDNLLIVFIVLQAFGVIGGALQPIRIFVLISIPFVMMYFKRNDEIIREYRYESFLFVFWIFYGMITLLWSIMLDESIKELLYLILNFFSFFTVIYFAKNAIKPQESLIKGWILLFIITLPIALYEFWFDIHLPIAFQDAEMTMNYEYEVFNRSFASVTFGNLNGYNVILCYIIPFVFGYLFSEINKLKSFAIWILLLLIIYIIVMNGSRGAVLNLLLGFTVFVLYYLKGKKSIIILTLISLFIIFISIFYFNDLLYLIFGRFEAQGFSDEGRTELLSKSWDALLNTKMVGVGAGNFRATMESVYKLENTAPHNLFLEVGIQYGLLIFIFFIGMFKRLYSKQKANPKNSSKFITITCLVMLPLTSTIDSSYILSISIWLFLASLYIIADENYNVN